MQKKQNRKTNRAQWERELEKESFWRKQITAWKASGQTVRCFARINGLSEPLFYSWRREIAIRERELSVASAAGIVPDATGIANNHVVDARGRVIPLKFRDTPEGGVKNGPFVPVSLLYDTANTIAPEGAASGPVAPVEQACPTIEINLPGRSILRVTKESDLGLLSQILAALEV